MSVRDSLRLPFNYRAPAASSTSKGRIYPGPESRGCCFLKLQLGSEGPGSLNHTGVSVSCSGRSLRIVVVHSFSLALLDGRNGCHFRHHKQIKQDVHDLELRTQRKQEAVRSPHCFPSANSATLSAAWLRAHAAAPSQNLNTLNQHLRAAAGKPRREGKAKPMF